MQNAIEILQKALQGAGLMQASPEATLYCNSIRLAIKVLEKYNIALNAVIEKELEKE